MIRFAVGCRRGLLVFALLSATAGASLAGADVSLDHELSFLQERMRNLQAQQTVEDLRRRISDLQKELDELAERAHREEAYIEEKIDDFRRMGLGEEEIQQEIDYLRTGRHNSYGQTLPDPTKILSRINELRRQLDEAQKTMVNFRDNVSGGQRERFFASVRHRLAAFTFDDPDATGVGDPISFLVSKKLLFSNRVPSFAIVNYRQGADRDSSTNVAYFDRVDAITKDQNFALAIWGRLSRTERGMRIDSFLQVPGDADKSPYVRTIRLPAAMGGGTLTARLKPDRVLVQSLDIGSDEINLLKTAAEQVATLHAGPDAAAAVIGRLGDGSGRTYTIIGSERGWVELRLADGSLGWTSVDQFCTGICAALLDIAGFTDDVVALTSGLPARPVSRSLTPEAEAMSQQLAGLVALSNNSRRAMEIAERWARGGSGRTSPAGAGFANLLAVARVKAELARMNVRGQKFDHIRLGRQAVERIANQLADASVADPSDVDVVENLAVLFGYLADNTRRRLALEIAANLKAKAH